MARNNYQLPITKTDRGFTIVEVVIVISIFLFTIGVVISLFISVFQSQRSVLSHQEIMNQMSYVQEYMSKALRMAKLDDTDECIPDAEELTDFAYLLTRPDVSDGVYRGIKFINQSDDDACFEFFLDTTDPAHPILKVLRNSENDADALPITAGDLIVEDISFAINGVPATISSGIRGATIDDNLQPRITVLFTVQIREGAQTATRAIQTTISQRNLNIVGD